MERHSVLGRARHLPLRVTCLTARTGNASPSTRWQGCTSRWGKTQAEFRPGCTGGKTQPGFCPAGKFATRPAEPPRTAPDHDARIHHLATRAPREGFQETRHGWTRRVGNVSLCAAPPHQSTSTNPLHQAAVPHARSWLKSAARTAGRGAVAGTLTINFAKYFESPPRDGCFGPVAAGRKRPYQAAERRPRKQESPPGKQWHGAIHGTKTGQQTNRPQQDTEG